LVNEYEEFVDIQSWTGVSCTHGKLLYAGVWNAPEELKILYNTGTKALVAVKVDLEPILATITLIIRPLERKRDTCRLSSCSILDLSESNFILGIFTCCETVASAILFEQISISVRILACRISLLGIKSITEIEDDLLAVVSIDIIVVSIFFLKRLEIVPFGLLCTDPVLAWENIRACV
jgi:hypothetical protein